MRERQKSVISKDNFGHDFKKIFPITTTSTDMPRRDGVTVKGWIYEVKDTCNLLRKTGLLFDFCVCLRIFVLYFVLEFKLLK